MTHSLAFFVNMELWSEKSHETDIIKEYPMPPKHYYEVSSIS